MSAALTLESVTAGFADPVREAQLVFRGVLDALSGPGRVVELAAAHGQPQYPASGAVALALLDFETPVWLSASFAAAGFAGWLRFHCGCPLTEDPAAAAFAFATTADLPDLAALNPGDAKYPDRAATLVIECPALDGGLPITLTGPGIASPTRIAPLGLERPFWTGLIDNRSRFQLGIDVLLASGRSLIGLPRSTRLLEEVS